MQMHIYGAAERKCATAPEHHDAAMIYLGVVGHLKIVPGLFSHMDLKFIQCFIDLISLEPKPLNGVRMSILRNSEILDVNAS
jgi:hypothetical protein